jgi:hypothetical protein
MSADDDGPIGTEMMTWLTFTLTAPDAKNSLPLWRRRVAVTDSGTIYAAAALAGPEQRVLMMAAFDGVPGVFDGPHLYLPIEWLRGEFPGIADICCDIFDLVYRHQGWVP